eukprot:GFUD01021015.1.p1 GENE.GFUD01021015.1~~GFUD01021015.1.p1  ORF type:complete len:1102 (+),score=357.95 GFUD01021015.1:297-3602(+)
MPPDQSMDVGVSSVVFKAISCVDVTTILSCSDESLRPILACLVRMSLIAPLDQSTTCLQGRTSVLQVLSRIELVNSIVALLSIDFHALETDVKKEQQLRQKVGSASTDSVLISNLSSGPSLEFERSDATRKLRLVLSELLALMANPPSSSNTPLTLKSSELFDHRVYLPEVCDVLAIALAELPALLQPTEVCEALLRLKHGPEMICHVVANQSDSFYCVVSHLLRLGDKQEEEGGSLARQRALLLLAKMNPSMALSMRARCVDWCRMPGLAVLLSLQQSHSTPAQADLVCWLSGLLLGTDQGQRSWISFWVRSGAKRKCPALAALRAELARQVSVVLEQCGEEGRDLPANCVRKGLALLRLFTALRGIAGMKFTEEEVKLLVSLITRRPPASPQGGRFVSTGLSILIACNSLIAQPGLEKAATAWIRWLVGWGQASTSQPSQGPGEMLLLSAIHFHAGQLSAVADLVCQTLGIRMTVRTNGMTRIKQIFTQEIFTEVVVAQHAVKVPVTSQLSSNLPGFLPVHCIHQLLKSRVFSKHKVSIKPWIYRQLCSSCAPLHPVLPPLIEAYVTSILLPSSARGTTDYLNEPLSEAEIRSVFSPPLFSLDTSGQVSSSGYTAQLCILYYILLYEDTRLSLPPVSTTRQPALPRPRYSAELLAELPLKFLLGRAESQQGMFEGLFPALLRLATTHFPHLCLVEDWLRPDHSAAATITNPKLPSAPALKAALSTVSSCPAAANLQLRQLLSLPPRVAWQLCPALVSNIDTVLGETVPRHTQELYKQVWLRLNTVYPRQLWLLTVNSLTAPPAITQEELALDPLAVLRCDERVFRTGPILQIVLYMLKACLAASRTRLSQYLVDQQPTTPALLDTEKEELRNSLVLTQESAAIQILLECCQEEESGEETGLGRLRAVQETQSQVCCYLHQAFIEDTNLAKLVHFQGYPHSLLAVTTAGVPSMFICLATAPELLSQPSLEKQVFAVDLISHLSVVCAMPNSLSTARLAVNAVWTLLGVLAAKEREQLLMPTLPALARMCRAFPPLIEDCIQLLAQAATMWISAQSVTQYHRPGYCMGQVESSGGQHSLTQEIVKTFENILSETVLANRIF